MTEPIPKITPIACAAIRPYRPYIEKLFSTHRTKANIQPTTTHIKITAKSAVQSVVRIISKFAIANSSLLGLIDPHSVKPNHGAKQDRAAHTGFEQIAG